MHNKVGHLAKESYTVLRQAATRFSQIDGTMWAGAFTYNAFFSMFPAIVLMVTIASTFVERQRATHEIVDYIEDYVPITGDMQSYIFDTISGVVQARSQASVVAVLFLVWGAIQCFTTLIAATNRARDGSKYSWWRLPLKSLGLFLVIAIGVLIGVAVPLAITLAGHWLPIVERMRAPIDTASGYVLGPTIVFLCLILLYRFAPRRSTSFREVWVGALMAAILLRIAERGFGIYIRDYASFNAIYGTFGGIMALLLWIYFSGCIFIFGACVSVVQAEHATPQESPSAPPADS